MDEKVTTEQVTQDAARVLQEMEAGRNASDARGADFDPAVRSATVAYFEARAADAEYSKAIQAVDTAGSGAARIAAEEAASEAFAAREAAKRAYSAHLK